MRICFMGTPDFGVKSLDRLIQEKFDVCAVITQPDRPAGRGKKLQPSPVKALAQEHGILVLQFERVRSPEAIDALRALAPDVCVTAAFGQILSKEFLSIPPLGVINVHGSLLPRYRGPAPIQWAVINGETVTGITTMYTDTGVDTGDILLQRPLEIGPDETAGELFGRMAALGADVLTESLFLLQSGRAPRKPQNHAQSTHFPMIKKEMARVDWKRGAKAICDLVRGMHPWPLAYTACVKTDIKLHRVRAAEGSGHPGEVLSAHPKKGLFVAAGQGAVEILELQAPGSKRMDASSYLLGHAIQEGIILGGEADDAGN
ncbi:MAG: methionyl-tRNA formyltransferase [Bacillota bacterium]